MANYKGIQGYTVQSLASDPTASEVEGQLWYNSASNVWKVSVAGAGAWAAGGATNTERGHLGGAGSSQTAGLIVGGIIPGGPTTGATESYDGTTWTEVNDLNAARQYFTAAGTQTAAITAGGMSSVYLDEVLVSEIWDGTSWSEEADLNTARQDGGAAGTTTAALCIAGGFGNAPPNLAIVEDYNGTSWTEVADINTARRQAGTSRQGTPSAALLFAGIDYPDPPYGYVLTESYNGTTWTEVADMGTARYALGSAGTQTDALGGTFPAKTVTEAWNGTAWTEVADLGVARYQAGSFGSTSSAVIATGQSTAPKAASEEWTSPVYAVKTVTTS
jgi:hypothetical protein